MGGGAERVSDHEQRDAAAVLERVQDHVLGLDLGAAEPLDRMPDLLRKPLERAGTPYRRVLLGEDPIAPSQQIDGAASEVLLVPEPETDEPELGHRSARAP
ncbi:MAG: hypothetical protein LVQ64_05185 [Thermoplasmatales archaeon]|nr:hypothetical protein [Thermoplasmatales archaeon]